jgi:hypothetical protein
MVKRSASAQPGGGSGSSQKDGAVIIAHAISASGGRCSMKSLSEILTITRQAIVYEFGEGREELLIDNTLAYCPDHRLFN